MSTRLSGRGRRNSSAGLWTTCWAQQGSTTRAPDGESPQPSVLYGPASPRRRVRHTWRVRALVAWLHRAELLQRWHGSRQVADKYYGPIRAARAVGWTESGPNQGAARNGAHGRPRSTARRVRVEHDRIAHRDKGVNTFGGRSKARRVVRGRSRKFGCRAVGSMVAVNDVDGARLDGLRGFAMSSADAQRRRPHAARSGEVAHEGVVAQCFAAR